MDQATFDVPLDSVKLTDGKLEFELKRFRGVFSGKLSDDGSQISGDWAQGPQPARPLVLHRFDPSKEPIPAKGWPLTAEERGFMTSHLERTRSLFLESISGVSEAQWKFKPAADRWSVAEVAEHITLSEGFLFKRATEDVMKVPPAPDRPMRTPAELKAGDEKVLTMVVDRSRRAQAPETLQPAGRFSGPDAVRKAFTEARQNSIEYIRKTNADLRNHAVVAGPLGIVDAYQQLLLMAGHTERHTLQINEVKAAASYPK